MSVIINGSAGVTTNSGAVYDGISRGTSVASTSGTSIDFTGIPSWVKRVTVMLNGVSTTGSSGLTVQIGTSGGIVTTGYLGASDNAASAIAPNLYSIGFNLEDATMSAANLRYYTCVLSNITGNTWMFSIVGATGTAAAVSWGGGSLALGGVLDRVRVTSIGGTDTFDAGSVNIMYE
jgi:hypothetical protein